MTKIQLRRDTSTNWKTNNPILASGEPAFETDTGVFKIGDGVTAYNSLPQVNTDGGGTSDAYTKAQTDGLLLLKEDVLTPQDPIEINDVFINPTENMTIGESGDIISNFTNWTSNSYRGGTWAYSFSEVQAGQKFLDVMKILGGIFVPFTFGNVYASPAVATSNNDGGDMPPVAIGYYENESTFIPVLTLDSNPFAKKFTSDSLVGGTYTKEFTTDFAFNNNSVLTGATENYPTFGNVYFQVFKTDIGTYKYTASIHWANNKKIQTATIDSSVYPELSKCTHIMFGPTYRDGFSSSSSKYSLSYSLNAQAKYNASTNLKEFAFTKDLSTVVTTTDEFNFQELMASGDNLIKLEQTVVHTISLNSTVTTQGNTFNGASQLVQMGSDGKLPAIDGSKLTNLPSSTPSNMMTTNTQQEITAPKQFNEGLTIYGLNKELEVNGGGGFSLTLRQAGGTSYIISDHDPFNAGKLILQGDNILCSRKVGTGAGDNLINIDSGNIVTYAATLVQGTNADNAVTALNGLKFWRGTQTDYNAIETKDENTLYIITG